MMRGAITAFIRRIQEFSSSLSSSCEDLNFLSKHIIMTECPVDNSLGNLQQTSVLAGQNTDGDYVIDDVYASRDAQPNVLPKVGLSRKEVYMHENDVKMAKNVGIGVNDVRVESHLLKLLLNTAAHLTSLSELNVSLFNFHSTRFAERLLRLNVGSLSLIESSTTRSIAAKEFARKMRKSDFKVEAYRANLESLFPPKVRRKQKKLPVKFLFGDKSLISSAINPLTLKKRQVHAEGLNCSGNHSAPVVIGISSTENQQLSLIESLHTGLILHFSRLSSSTVFQYGAVQLITFLTARVYAMVMSAQDQSLGFISRVERHRSWFLNKMFSIQPILDSKGVHRTKFEPHFPRQKSISYEKKLSEMEILNGLLYGISIRPKEVVNIGDVDLISYATYEDDEKFLDAADILLKYAFWMRLTSKLSMNTKFVCTLREWFPHKESELKSLLNDDIKVSQMNMEAFDQLFILIHKFFDHEECSLCKEKTDFVSKFLPISDDSQYAD